MIHMHFFTLIAQTHEEGDYCNLSKSIWVIDSSNGKLVLEALLFLKCIMRVFTRTIFQWHFLKFPPSSFPQTRKHIILPIWGSLPLIMHLIWTCTTLFNKSHRDLFTILQKLFNQTSITFPNYSLNNYNPFFDFFCSNPSNYGILKLKLQVVRLVKNSYWIWIRAQSLDFKLVQDLIWFKQYNDGKNIESLDHIKRKCWFIGFWLR